MPRRKRGEPTYEQIVADFVQGCGLRTGELERLRVRDFSRKKRVFVYDLQWIHVTAHDDIPAHDVPVLEIYAWTIAQLCQGCAPDDLVFETLPALDDIDQDTDRSMQHWGSPWCCIVFLPCRKVEKRPGSFTMVLHLSGR